MLMRGERLRVFDGRRGLEVNRYRGAQQRVAHCQRRLCPGFARRQSGHGCPGQTGKGKHAGQCGGRIFSRRRHEIEQGNTTAARGYYESALRLQPENAILLAHYTVLLLRAGATREGLAAAEHAVRVAPESADAYAVLERLSMHRIAPGSHPVVETLADASADPAVERLLAKAQKDAATEESFFREPDQPLHAAL